MLIKIKVIDYFYKDPEMKKVKVTTSPKLATLALVSIAINHQISEHWQLKYFYRYQKVDYKGDGFIYDMEIIGSGIGVIYIF